MHKKGSGANKILSCFCVRHVNLLRMEGAYDCVYASNKVRRWTEVRWAAVGDEVDVLHRDVQLSAKHGKVTPALHDLNFLHAVYAAEPRSPPPHTVVFTTAYKDRIKVTGRRRGMQYPPWIEVVTKHHFADVWDLTVSKGIFGPYTQHATIARRLRNPSFAEPVPRLAYQRARP